MGKKTEKWDIELASINKTEPGGKYDSGLRITFRVKRNPDFLSFESTYTVPTGVDDADAIRLARSYFHNVMRSLGEQTAGWQLSDKEREAIIPKVKS